MMTMKSSAARIAGRRDATASACRATRLMSRRPMPVRAQASPDEPSTSAPTPLQGLPPPAAAAATADFKLLGATQEAINGRSAMLGFVAAVVAESLTHHSVWSQVAGKYVDTELIEKPIGAATLGFGAIVFLVTMATLVPKLVDGLEVDSRSFGPFTPGLEKLLGRVAMMGFSGVLLVELVKGSSLL